MGREPLHQRKASDDVDGIEMQEAASASNFLAEPLNAHTPALLLHSHSDDEEHAGAPGSATAAEDAAAEAPVVKEPLWRRLRTAADPRNWHPLSGWSLLSTYLLLTFAQQLPTTAVGLILANELHYGNDEVSFYYAATFVPWTIRPVYAFVSDQVPLFGFRRRPYFVICAVLACGAQVSLALWGNTKHNFLVLGVATQIFLAFCEVVCDSLAVEWGNELAVRVVNARIKAAEAAKAAPASAAAQPVEQQAPPQNGASDGDADSFYRPLANSASPGVEAAISVGSPRSPVELLADAPPRAEGDASQAASDAEPAASTPQDERTDALAAKLLSETPDPSTLTPLLLKSRIQSECMSVRTLGSVCASILTTYIMLVYLSPRSTLLWGSMSFLLGLVSMACYRSERKVGTGYFGLATTGVDTAAADSAAAAAAPSASEATPTTALLQQQRHTRSSSNEHAGNASPDASVEAVELSIDPAGAHPIAASPSEDYAALHDGASDSAAPASASASSAAAAAPEEFLYGMERSRWRFLWGKLLALLQAIRLLLGPLVFIFLLNLMPTSGDAYYNFLYTEYGAKFSSSQFSSFNLLALVGSLLGCLLYQHVVAPRKRDLRWVFVWTTLAASVAGCAQIAFVTHANRRFLSDEAWLLLMSCLINLVEILPQLPAIVLASYYAPKHLGLEASMFSLFAASAHVGALGSAPISAALVRGLGLARADSNFTNMWKLILICNVTALLPLIVMPVLLHPRVTGRREEDENPAPVAGNAETERRGSAAAADADEDLQHEAGAVHEIAV